MTRYVPTWREIDVLAKAGDMASLAESRGDYETARRLDNLADRLRNGDRTVTNRMDNLAINTYGSVYGYD